MPTVRETTLHELDRAHLKPPPPERPDASDHPGPDEAPDPLAARVAAMDAKPRHRSARRVVLA
jgi:hypothetical protein